MMFLGVGAFLMREVPLCLATLDPETHPLCLPASRLVAPRPLVVGICTEDYLTGNL